MPETINTSIENLDNLPKFKKGDKVEVDVFRSNVSGLFNGLVPKFIFDVLAQGSKQGTWILCDVGTDNVRMPGCPENLMKKV
jgi:hypothetical protein